MKNTCCQTATRGGDHNPSPASRWRRAREIAEWMVPGTLLLLVPKCPVCLAAYVALATGIGVSLPTAGLIRTTLLIICGSALVVVASLKMRRFVLQKSSRAASRRQSPRSPIPECPPV